MAGMASGSTSTKKEEDALALYSHRNPAKYQQTPPIIASPHRPAETDEAKIYIQSAIYMSSQIEDRRKRSVDLALLIHRSTRERLARLAKDAERFRVN